MSKKTVEVIANGLFNNDGPIKIGTKFPITGDVPVSMAGCVKVVSDTEGKQAVTAQKGDEDEAKRVADAVAAVKSSEAQKATPPAGDKPKA